MPLKAIILCSMLQIPENAAPEYLAVDPPCFGGALIGRLLEAQGMISQPDWKDPFSFQTRGEPNSFVSCRFQRG